MKKAAQKIAEVLIALDGKKIVSCQEILSFQSDPPHDTHSDKIFYNKYHEYYVRPCKKHEGAFIASSAFEEVK